MGTMRNYIGYKRFDGKDEAALVAQQEAIDRVVSNEGGTLVKSYEELEPSRDRWILQKALSESIEYGAILVIAKMQGLYRNIPFMLRLLDSGVDIRAADDPTVNRRTLQLLCAIAEEESNRVSIKVKAALVKVKKRGVKLGSNRFEHWYGREHLRLLAADKGCRYAARANRKKRIEAYKDLLPMMTDMRKSGKTLRDIAAALNSEGHMTRRGKPWREQLVWRVLQMEDA